MHKLLERQLKKGLGWKPGDPVPGPLKEFVDLVDRAYADADTDRALQQRSMELASRELEVKAAEYRRAEEKLKESESRFRILADCAPVLVWMSGTDMLCDFFNEVWLQFTGRSLEQEMGNGWAEGVHPDDFQRCLDIYVTSFKARKPFRMEYRLRRHDGQYRWILDQGTPRYTPGNEFAGYIGSCIDVTDFKDVQGQLEARVKDRTLELERSNTDLAQFAYAASHDLQEPLRMVSSYVELLRKKYAGKMDAKAEEYIAYAVDGAQRMRQLIQDLLAYSQVGAEESRFAPVSCDGALAAALADLKESIAESGARIAADPLPTVQGHATLLAQLFQNLVGNAIKYHGPAAPEIRVSAERQGTEGVFSVRDNGIGIDPRHFNHLFRIFQRLHSKSAYPGTGIGLATCKKIVERHGGRIWVESRPGQGAAFKFTLPAPRTEARQGGIRAGA